MTKLCAAVRDERTRSFATWLNNISVTCFAAGVLAPMLSLLAAPNPDLNLANLFPRLAIYLFTGGFKAQLMLAMMGGCIGFRVWAHNALAALSATSVTATAIGEAQQLGGVPSTPGETEI